MVEQIKIWKYSNPALILLGLGFLIIIPVFWGGISELAGRWESQEEYSHGYMIPLVTAYLIWQRRNLLRTLEFKPTWFPVSLVILGLMAIPPFEPEVDRARDWFSKLRELRDSMVSSPPWTECPGQLSMGMSHDYELAIEEGATHIRIGTALFGARET